MNVGLSLPLAGQALSRPRAYVAAAVLACAVGIASAAGAQDCRPILRDDTGSASGVSVVFAGKHCLQHDFRVGREFDLHSAAFKGPSTRSLIAVTPRTGWKYSPDGPFELDMQGHHARADVAGMDGVRGIGPGRNVIVRNGTLTVAGQGSTGVRLLLRSRAQTAGMRSPIESEYEDVSMPEAADTGQANFLLSRLNIRAGGRGVIMSGAGNSIRDSTIEVDGGNAIFLHGRGSVIENNTIIVHARAAGPNDAVIKLRDADGAVIRNNRIIYKGDSRAATAINLLGSNNVRVENNIVEGIDEVVRQTGKTSVREQGTQRR
ncbi:right-handed parallel beta-helix repeat-containing protein ['Massilia aquatica' Lu et al. 2020]|uniref:Right handed beta helix domain-containing protein n=1 Tax=Pseudoduganella aquatica TaxID=2660641 RepID=A0A7X4HBA4_9BURK|nr:hypothetical protein [Pseudoduganella aquatica]